MPILPHEPDIWPESLFQQEAVVQGTGTWWALYTLPRREKDLMRRLLRMEVPFYSPMVKRRSHSPSGRARTSYVPLFPGYVFLFGSEEQRYKSLTTNCVSRCLEVSDGRQLAADLEQIHKLIVADAPLTPEARIEAGMRIRVRSGPFAGLEGMVIKRRGMQRLLVVVHFLQQGASVQLEDYQVERIDS
jgi:transcription antitermination factor NusG